jgi:multidrug efflux pump
MLAVVILALLFVPIFFVWVQNLFSPDKPKKDEAKEDAEGAATPAPSH